MKSNLKKLQAQVDSFNQKYAVGDKVKIRKPGGHMEVTVKYPASIMGDHSAVGWFKEISACYDLDCVIK